MTRGGVFLTTFEVFGNRSVHNADCGVCGLRTADYRPQTADRG